MRGLEGIGGISNRHRLGGVERTEGTSDTQRPLGVMDDARPELGREEIDSAVVLNEWLDDDELFLLLKGPT